MSSQRRFRQTLTKDKVKRCPVRPLSHPSWWCAPQDQLLEFAAAQEGEQESCTPDWTTRHTCPSAAHDDL